jgi:glycosyltransferase involved in cell wall biosynthesis
MKEKRRLKIALLTTNNPQTSGALDGTTYFIYRALQEHCGDVKILGPIRSLRKLVIGRLLNKVTQVVLRRHVAYEHLHFVLRKEARIIEHRLYRQSYDLIVAAEATPELAFIQTTIPIVLIEAATFTQRRMYDPACSRLTERSALEADEVESRAYNSARAILLNSQWAAQSMIQEYFIDPQRVYSVPFGAPLLTMPPKEIALTKRRSYHCTLLFICDDWRQKGGDIAYMTLLALEKDYNIQAELIVCGTTPPAKIHHPRLKIMSTLERSNQQHRQQLESFYLRSDFLLHPTRCEMTGMLCCEASAYGVPSLVAQSGAAADSIRDGLNGILLPLNAHGAEYAQQIAALYQDEQRYHTLVLTCRQHFEEYLNWDAWGKATQTIFQDLLN